MKTTRTTQRKINIGVRLTRRQLDALNAISRRDGITKSEVIREGVEYALNKRRRRTV